MYDLPMRLSRTNSTLIAGCVACLIGHMVSDPMKALSVDRPASLEGVENLCKLMVPVARLGPSEVEKHLKPLILARLSGVERNAANLMMNGFSDWICACQQYRHAPGSEDLEPPSLEFAIWIVSEGAAHLRWLAGIDKRQDR